MQEDNGLKVSSTYRNILRIALPISIAILIPQLNMLMNTLFLGNYTPSTTYYTTSDMLAASGLAGIYYLTMVMVDYGLVSGILMLMSRKAGENDRTGLGKLFSHGVFLCLLLSISLLIISLWLAPALFRLFIHEEKVQVLATGFIRWRIWGLPFMVICQLSNSLFLAMSKSRLIIYGSATQTLVNVVFDYLLIFGVGIFPELGIQGSAIASVLSELAYLAVVLFIIRQSRHFTGISWRAASPIDWHLIRSMLYKSSPLILQYFLSIGAWEVFFIYVEHLGKSESALSQIYRSVFGLVGVAAWALASTSNSMVSNLIGQKAYGEVIPLIKRIITVSFMFAFIAGMPLLVFPEFFLRLLTSDSQLVEKGIGSFQIVVVATWMLSVSTIVFNAMVGTGHTLLNMKIEIAAIVLYLIYNTVVIEWLRMPLAYAWMSEFIYWLTLFVLSAAYFYSGKWKKAAA